MKIPFIPIQGKDEVIKKQTVREGNIYFATDSGKIYLDTATDHMPIGGSGAAVMYASAKNVVEDLVDFTYLLNRANDLDDKTTIPKKDDLIINSDGRFFKVLSYNGTTDIIKCNLIAVSGTGGGGGGNTPGGGTTPSKYVTLKSVDASPDTQVYIYGQSQYVKFTATATDDAKITLSYTITSAKDANLSQTYYSEILNGEIDEFDLGSKLYKGDNTLRVKATGSNSGSEQLNYMGLNSITLALKESKNFNPLKYAFNDNLPFYCIPVGEINKTLEVYLNNETTPVVTDVYNATITEEIKGVTVPKRDHGVYPLKAVLSYSTGIGKISTDPLMYEVAFVDSNEMAPLIWFKPYPKKIVDHDKLTLEYMVYDPSKPTDTTVERWINGTQLTDLEGIAYSDKEWHQWNISNYKLGVNTFSIKCGNTTRDIVIEVEEDLIRNLETVTAGLFLNLDTLDRSNKENKTSRETWEYKHTDGSVTAVKFNNFNWYNNGWINDPEINNSVLRVSNGASIEIPLSLMNLTDLSDSLTFEIRFKIRNVQEYENLIKYTAILDDNGEVESVKKEVISEKGVWGKYYNNGIGMCLGTQEGFFKGSSNIVAGRYKED
jgi:hypothetical protein